MSYGCDDPYKHEREGRDAAYARGYEREQRHQEELRQEEREREEYEMRQAYDVDHFPF